MQVFDGQGAVAMVQQLLAEGRDAKAVTNRLINAAVRGRLLVAFGRESASWSVQSCLGMALTVIVIGTRVTICGAVPPNDSSSWPRSPLTLSTRRAPVQGQLHVPACGV